MTWERRLNEYLLECRGRPFEYGQFDCLLFVCGAVEAMTGENPAAHLIGRYTSQDEAEALEGMTLYQWLIRTFGSPIPPAYARRGDIAWVNDCCAVVVGTDAIGFDDGEMCLVPMIRAKRAFRAR